jgi:hypothetical protein
MHKTLCALSLTALLAVTLYGCGEQINVERDHVDPESLKAMEHPPPGVPGAPSKAGAAPGAPSNAGTAPGAPANSGAAPGAPSGINK